MDTRVGSFDRIAAGYDLLATLFGPDKNTLFCDELPNGRRAALDVGCGSGVLAAELSSHFDRVVGVDVSASMLDIARTRRGLPNVDYVQMDAAALDLPQRFDLICSANTMHHIPDVPSTLETLKRHLRPGGWIIVVDNLSAGIFNPQSRPFRGNPPPWVFRLGAVLDAPGYVRRFGIGDAARAVRFCMSREWCRHLSTDRYLDRAGFERVYGTALPGCRLTPTPHGFMRVAWDAPEAATG